MLIAHMTNKLNQITRKTPIDALNLSTRPYNALRRHSIQTIGELTQLSYSDLSAMRTIGMRARLEISETLMKHGLKLKEGRS